MTPAAWAFLIDSVPFTKATRDGETSLGGSESACLGVGRALKARGHDVHFFASKLAPDASGVDAWGCAWHPLGDFSHMNQFIEWDVVVGLRMADFFNRPIHARMRVLWNQDLLTNLAGKQVMSVAWNLDKSLYVSEYHRAQWEDVQPELKPIGAVTRNGFDPAHVPAESTKDPNRIIHISRPERGLAPLLAMWPEVRKANPRAELHVCRYQSMYDGEGSNVKAMCLSFDAQVAAVNDAFGGITYLGSLNKVHLYKAIADAAVMWYPGVSSFAETSCIAAIEAQACGTPFVGSLKGALAETARPSFERGLLFSGDAEHDPDYQDKSIEAVLAVMDGCRRNSVEYRTLQSAGRGHMLAYTYDAIAQAWESQVCGWFRERYESNKLRVLRQLLHEDDHTTAKRVAEEIPEGEAFYAVAFCDRVIEGKEQGAEDYAAHAIQDPIKEVELSERFMRVSPAFEGCTKILDVACGNGAGAIRFLLDNPDLYVVGLDYADANIRMAREAAERAGVADRCEFHTATIWNLEGRSPNRDIESTIVDLGPFDGLFVGEFVEHVADCDVLIDWLDTLVEPGAQVVYTCPVGPFVELAARGMYIQRGHVHCFRQDDVKAVWGNKAQVRADYFAIGQTPRFNPVGHWIIRYRVAPERAAGVRDYVTRAIRTRPQQKLSVGLIAKDAENDLGRCLSSVWAIADEIVVGDTGSGDATIEIAKRYGARIVELPSLADTPEGFAGARNAVLDSCSGDWFLWIDSDEQLMHPHMLRMYLHGSTFNGYVIRQHHLQLDAKPHYDIPVRLFRNDGRIRFYGCIHEQPQQDDCNGDIYPSLELIETVIAHTGYLTESQRRDKMLWRNLPLLHRDVTAFPDRELGKVLVLRDSVNLADFECEEHGLVTEKARKGYAQAARLFVTHFDDPAHKYHAVARPWYEQALKRLGLGYEIELALVGRPGGLEHRRAKPERIWVRGADELERYVSWRTKNATDGMRPEIIKTDPFVLPQAVSV